MCMLCLIILFPFFKKKKENKHRMPNLLSFERSPAQPLLTFETLNTQMELLYPE